jgi:hypothetical protein
MSLGAYFVSLVGMWMLIVDSLQLSKTMGNILFYLAAANYLFLVWSAYQIQNTLHESGLYQHAGWQVWVGALLLNPLFLGWWIPVRVLLTARHTRSALRARWPDGRQGEAQ